LFAYIHVVKLMFWNFSAVLPGVSFIRVYSNVTNNLEKISM